ncbi:aspartate racemase [Dethiosulfatarculus sandiegensis]|uniref:Aspartate racemase n=1 Tax=Dethiosulfatarculus sandiegensis TaxID=1429043 RepID=A0A0D2GK32_9BACT|nr:aspartate racemase [Dethiosulfatarculus sandiegensis]
MSKEKIIGIVGGVGPYAGLDLNRKIYDHTIARSDQEHLPVILASLPSHINDRTRYLLKRDVANPAQSLYEIIVMLESVGACVAGIPCNTAHATEIFPEIEASLKQGGHHIKLLNMISEVVRELKAKFGTHAPIGVLNTMGTYKSGLYKDYLDRGGIPTILPDEALAQEVHSAIYHPEYGIKAQSNPVSPMACKTVELAVRALGQQGAAAVILGCTELPLALPADSHAGVGLIDPARILARSLIKETYPEKLKSL